ncbi:MAG TPA: hypothetical protein VFD51_00160 [Patescibacteria group bacterium]|nr:hypothetical protein [Patescibacteria group bacterium]
MKGKIPLTEKIELEKNEARWRMLVSGLVNDLQMSGIVDSCDGNRVKIQLLIKTIIAPESMRSEYECFTPGNLSQEISSGHSRIFEHLMGKVYGKSWIFFGFITGKVNKPIVINYFPWLDIFIYSQKLNKERESIFAPNHYLN